VVFSAQLFQVSNVIIFMKMMKDVLLQDINNVEGIILVFTKTQKL